MGNWCVQPWNTGDAVGDGGYSDIRRWTWRGPDITFASMSEVTPVVAETAPQIHTGPTTGEHAGSLSGASAVLLLVTFASAIFLNAALLFAVQPMFTKMVLPLLGGSPAIWNTCLLFFQTALLAGYLYAHLTSRIWSPKVQAGVHLVLLLGSLALLPIRVPSAWSHPTGTVLPIPWLLGLLTVSLGAPFFLLAAGAPMLQRWFASTRHRAADNPYFLYAASNLGSFAALLAYPFLIEPRLRVSEQTVSWLEIYYFLIALLALCALMTYLLRGARATGPMVSVAASAPEAAVMVPPSVASVDAGVVTRQTKGSAPFVSSGDVRDATGGGEAAASTTIPGASGMPDASAKAPGRPTIIPNRHWRLRWVLLAFAPSSLLIGVTTYLSTDIASVPFLWVIPLALYLLTFVLVFARRPPLGRGFMLLLQLALGLALMVSICIGPGRRITTQAALHLLAFFVTAMVCHRELADSRPRAEHLTEFYLWMSLGGVLGGVFNVILAPQLYDTLIEYPFALVIALGLRPSFSRQFGSRRALLLDLLLPALVCAAVWGGYRLPKPPDEWGTYGTQIFLGVAGLVVALFWKRPFRLALGAFAIYGGARFADAANSDIIFQRRSFFGIYRVRQILEYTVLQNGTTTHGAESTNPERRLEPITYYFRGGPLGQIFETVATSRPLRRVAVVGLGTGTTACYGRTGERWTYYEIDPLVVRIARSPSLFSYIRDCPPTIDIVLGDARLSLAQAPDSEFDLIILDAFTSDAIPAHLLTREALALYRRKLRDGGAVAFHISNRYVDLRPVLTGLADDARIPGAVGDRDVTAEERLKLYYGSRWVVLANKPATLATLLRQPDWTPLPPEPATRVWTDDYSDILSVLRWR